MFLGEGIRWDRNRGTHDLNMEGPGIYLSTSPGNAASYGPYLHRIYLKGNPMLLRSNGPMPTMAKMLALAKLAPVSSRLTFVSNWGHEHLSPATLRDSLSKYRHQSSVHDAFQTLYGDLFLYNANAFVEAMLQLGIDGVLVDRRTDWRPDQLHLVVYNRRMLCDPELVTLSEDMESVEK